MYVEVPMHKLSEEAIVGLVEEYCSREGTDYGMLEFSLDEKVSAVTKELQNGTAKIFFHQEDQSINILAVDQIAGLPKFNHQANDLR
ncbi:MAG: YheU family protein [Oligoflexales bacterium]